jgi:ubiquitin-like protein Pup
MAEKEPSGQPPGPDDTAESDDVGAILDDMDEALEADPEAIIEAFRQEGGQ